MKRKFYKTPFPEEYTKCIKSSAEWKEQQVFMKFPLKISRYLVLLNFFVAGDMSFIK